MQNGKFKPFISQETVRAALDALLYTSKPLNAPNPLESLVLVDEFLANPDIPAIHHARHFAIQHILSNIIIDTFSQLRGKVGYSALTLMTPLEVIIEDIEKLASCNNPDLIGWSLLYYRYIRVDLSIGVEVLAQKLTVDERTLRRHFNHGLRRLTEYLVDAEWSTRTRQRKRRLLGLLPSRASTPIIGREREFDHLKNILKGEKPHHIQITGAPGIGKSTFVQELLRHRIETEQLDHLIWLHMSPSVEYVRQCLYQAFIPEASTITLHEFMQLYRVAVVLDGTDLLISESAALGDLFGQLIFAEIYFISGYFISMAKFASHIHLSELNFTEAARLVQLILTQDYSNEGLSNEELQKLWYEVGGNPQGIRLAVRDSAFGINNHTHMVGYIYDVIYDQLEDNLRSVWIASAVFPSEYVEASAEQHPFKNQLLPRTELYALSRLQLLEISLDDPRRFFLTSSARHFLYSKYHNSDEARNHVDAIILQLEQDIEEPHPDLLVVFEKILLEKWPPLDEGRYISWVKKLAHYGLQRGHHVEWRTILEGCLVISTENNASNNIAYGICLRRLSEWPKAQQVFQRTISYCGQHGLFPEQSSAMLELAILWRYQGKFQRALALLHRVEQLILRGKDEELIRELRIEQAHIAVERGDVVNAQKYLLDVESEDGRVLMLHSDISRLTGNYVECRRWADRVLLRPDNDKSTTARVHTAIGRSYELELRWHEAHHHFEIALNLFERDDSLFGLGRGRLNLGAVLIQEKLYEEAYHLLKEAESSFAKLDDKAALAATHHNLRLLKILSVS